MKLGFLSIPTSLILLGAAMPAAAHTGAGAAHGYLNGLLHPLSGIDHLLVMLGVGLWAGILGGRLRWQLPAVFLMTMAAGAGLSFAGFPLLMMETWVAVSVLVLGLILCLDRQSQTVWAVSLASVFAFGHGYVHAEEIGAGIDAFSYVAGFLLGTALLLSQGAAAGLLSPKAVRIIKKIFGLVCAITGTVLLAGV